MMVLLPTLYVGFYLGMTYDLRTYERKYNLLFHNNEYKEIPVSDPKVNATYMVLPEDSFPYDHFGIPIDIAVLLKHSSAAIGGPGSDFAVLDAAKWRKDSVTVVVKFVYRTGNQTVKGKSPLPGMLDKIKDSSTHYVETYNLAGQAYALFRYSCQSDNDRKQVRELFTSRLGESGDITAEAAENFQKAIQELEANADLNRRVSYEVNTRASSFEINDYVAYPQHWMKVIEELPNTVGNKSIISMELQPLRNLDVRFPDVKKHEKQVDQLRKVDMMMDDLKFAKDAIRSMDESITDPEKDKTLYTLEKVMQKVKRSFWKFVGDANLYKLMNQVDIKTAFDDYYTGLESTGHKTYYEAVQALAKD